MVIHAVVVVVVAVVSVLVVGSRKRGCRSYWSPQQLCYVFSNCRRCISVCPSACGNSARSIGVLPAASCIPVLSWPRLTLSRRRGYPCILKTSGLRFVLRRARLLLTEPITHQEVSGSLVGLVQILQSLLYFLHALGSVFRGFFW